ncbi:sulfotransferase family 2 domain-containing protein [Campylobacter volucris]|uniref:sulfotransferase family 2 domain-containing protein n=1 Tax=Campylobacter volucris TaxID=1031542 RepID=UPI0010599F5F|nr:sulfotransferase family 2 domain-containing protein [Campylobacter volucris]TDJ81119.1 hypothetical protein E2O25_02635 [Campylobacter volucris]TDJ87593.1 hypothetical protein E2O24_00335 [Campylobacter volucris]
MRDNLIKDFQRKLKCIFIHVPKAAGTSIEQTIFQANKWLSGHIKARDYLKNNPDEFNNFFSFGFTRNPHDRFVSAFFYLKKGGGTIDDNLWAKKYIEKYNSFEEFVLALNDERNKYIIINWIHFLPQYYFLCNKNKKILVNFVGKTENIQEDFQKVCLHLNIKRDIKVTNSSKHAHYLSYYNKTTYQIVYKIYKNDFKIFNYRSEEDLIVNKDFSILFKIKLYIERINSILKYYICHPKKIFKRFT